MFDEVCDDVCEDVCDVGVHDDDVCDGSNRTRAARFANTSAVLSAPSSPPPGGRGLAPLLVSQEALWLESFDRLIKLEDEIVESRSAGKPEWVACTDNIIKIELDRNRRIETHTSIAW